VKDGKSIEEAIPLAKQHILDTAENYRRQAAASKDPSSWAANKIRESIPSLERQAALVDTFKPSDFSVPQGSLYALDYPDELLPRTLDFDAPLSTQTPEVRAALEKAGLRAGRTATVVDRGVDIRGRQNGFEMHVTGPTGAVEIHGPYYDKSSAENAAARINSPGAWDDPRGEDLYKALVNKFGGQGNPEAAEKASRFLADAGIPGHKFFDQGSRMEGEGTRNFVVYDPDKTLKTLGRYPNLEEFLKAHPEVPR
jgi:hypothetical protein